MERGGRHGCKFGGVIFNLGYVKAMNKFYVAVDEENIPVRVRFVRGGRSNRWPSQAKSEKLTAAYRILPPCRRSSAVSARANG